MKATAGKVILKPIEKKMLSEHIFRVEAGINSAPTEGIVCSLGTETDEVQVGDTVMFEQGTGLEIEIEGNKHLIMRFDQLQAIIS